MKNMFTITYRLHEPKLPHHYIEATDDEGNTFGFHTDGVTAKPTDFYGATMMSGNVYDDFGNPVELDKPVTRKPTSIYATERPHPEMVKRDLKAIRAAIQAVTSEPLHFSNAGTTTVTI